MTRTFHEIHHMDTCLIHMLR